MTVYRHIQKFLFVSGLFLLAACGAKDDLSQPPEPMGDFLLGHNIVKAKDVKIGPLSRKATPEEWEKSVSEAISARIGRYDGTHYFHLGTHIDGYVLAQPGIPVVAAPKSVLIISVNVWDDETGEKLTEKPKVFTVFERSNAPAFIIGSGLVNSKEQQMQNLSENAARHIHKWLLENQQWFVHGDAKAIKVDKTIN